MKISSRHRRSVSPFGVKVIERDEFDELQDIIDAHCPQLKPQTPRQLGIFQDICHLSGFLRTIAQAPANDCPELTRVCDFLVKHHLEITVAGLFETIFYAMQNLFKTKTELFMVDHHDKDHCKKMGWPVEYRDLVLFSQERDVLVGQFFDRFTKDSPGHFSDFMRQWSESDNPDRLCHFLDFCGRMNHASFDFYLLGTHPGIARILRDKDTIRMIFQTCSPLLRKIKSPTWERDLRKVLGIVPE